MIHIWRPWKVLPPPDLGGPITNDPPSLRMITNQLKESIIQGWLLYVIRSFLSIIIHILVLILHESALLAQLKHVNKLWNNNSTCMWATKPKQKQNQVTSHSNWPRVVLFDLAHKQCSGIIKGWVHVLTSVKRKVSCQ